MWEMIERMASDRLWIYTGIVGSLAGAAFLFWFKDTRMAIWTVSKFDTFMENLARRYGWKWLQEPEDLWRKRYPRITKKIDLLEERIKKLEGK
jgi:hypothetical protein